MYWLSPWLTLNTARLHDGSTSSEAYWQPNSMTIHPLAQEYLSACVHDQRIINLSRLDYWSDKSMPWKWAGKLIGISTTFHSLLTKMQQIQSTLYFKNFFVINLSENKYVHFKSNYHQKKNTLKPDTVYQFVVQNIIYMNCHNDWWYTYKADAMITLWMYLTLQPLRLAQLHRGCHDWVCGYTSTGSVIGWMEDQQGTECKAKIKNESTSDLSYTIWEPYRSL